MSNVINLKWELSIVYKNKLIIIEFLYVYMQIGWSLTYCKVIITRVMWMARYN